MKRFFIPFAVLSLLTISAHAAEIKPMAAQKLKLVIVKIRSFDKSISYETMTPEDLKKLELDIKMENKFLPQAIDLVGKEWKKDPQLKKKAFPGSQIASRQATPASPPMDEDAAVDKLSRMQEQLSARQADQAKKAEEEAKKAAEAAKTTGAKAEDKKGKQERENLLAMAIEKVTAKIQELKAGSGAPKATNAPAAPAAAK